MKEKKPKLNVKLLRQIVKHLKEEPKRYDQGKWGLQICSTEPGAPACGTQGCIAGWAVFLSVPQELWPNLFAGGVFKPGGEADRLGLNDSPATRAAQRLVGVTDDEAHALFAVDNQSYSQGEEGVKEAEAKIRSLIRDRKKFVESYAY